MNIKITITLSKIFAFLTIALAVWLDFGITASASTFMYALPFCSALLLGKQVIDRKKSE